MDLKQYPADLDHLAANTIRMLAIDAVEKANSGHPGMPMGMADIAYVLWARHLVHSPKNPEWINRDRFILSAGHGSMLLYSMLHLSGYHLSMEDIKNFRQLNSKTPGHPEKGHTPGVETTTGPLGQGFANGIGMAVASRILAEKMNAYDSALISHYIYGIVSDGDLMEGVASEAASVAGHLGLGNVIYFYDSNSITIEGKTDLTFSEDVSLRFKSYNWHVQNIDGHNHADIEKAILDAQKVKNQPSIIIAKTHIAFGSPNKVDDASSHGAPLGSDEILAVRKALNWPSNTSFYIPKEVKEIFDKRALALAEIEKTWTDTFGKLNNNEEFAKTWNTYFNPELPEDIGNMIWNDVEKKNKATRAHSGAILQTLANYLPGMVSGSADLDPSCKSRISNSESISNHSFKGRNIHYGIREHAMASMMNGMALYGSCIPCGSTFFVFSDYMRPALRLGALMNLQVIYILTHDSIFVGEDGPTHQPVEHLASLRCMPNLTCFRPADLAETIGAWIAAVKRKTGPTILCLTRQTVPELESGHLSIEERINAVQKGAYVITSEEHSAKPDIILIGTGSELYLAVESAAILKKNGINARVVSMPSLDCYLQMSETDQMDILPLNTPTVVVEAGVEHCWRLIDRHPFLFLGMDRFGASAPGPVLAEKFGFTIENVAGKILQWFKNLKKSGCLNI